MNHAPIPTDSDQANEPHGHFFRLWFSKDGRLSILRLEQLLKGKITSNTTFQVKAATGRIGIGGSQQLESNVEVFQQLSNYL